MLSFTTYLTEKAQSKHNLHLTHLEDVILDDGPAGVKFALDILKEFGKVLNGGVSKAMNVNMKWDGAPAIHFGPDPVDGKFFVATKGAFAKTPKLAKSHADIDAMYGAGPSRVLHIAFDALKATNPPAVIQGDALFTAADLKRQSINGVDYVAFQPNTIMYAVDVTSPLGQRILNADFGIALHTLMAGKGSSLDALRATALPPSIFAQLRKPRNVVLLDSAYDDLSGTVSFTTSEYADYQLAIEAVSAAAASVNKSLYGTLLEEPFHSLVQRFINDQVKQNRQVSGKEHVNDLEIFLSSLKEKEVAARKSDAGKKEQAAKFDSYLKIVASNRSSLAAWFTLHAAIQRAKEIIIAKLSQASEIGTFIPTGSGLEVSGPEGFVAFSHSGKTVKLVSRYNFSRMNFAMQKSWR